jgi:hypothetical protein
MPVDFLTEEQERRYGRYAGEPTAAQLARYFHLDDADRELLADRRADHNRLGMALQIVTVRFLGTFQDDPTDVPVGVIAHLAAQLNVPPTTDLSTYQNGDARWDHAIEIRQRFGYRDFTEQPEHFRLVRWLYTRAWLSAERPSVLFDLATARLVERKILLPGVTTLTRLVAAVRDRSAQQLWRTLAELPDRAVRQHLEDLLVVPVGGRQTPLDRLRTAPARANAPTLVDALRRLEEVRALGARRVDLSGLPPGRLKVLARYAAAARAQAIARMPEPRRIATLLAFAHQLEATALDDALDVLDSLIENMLDRVEHDGERARLRTLRDLDAAALRLREACLILLDETKPDPAIRAEVFAHVSREQVAAATQCVGELARPPDDQGYYEGLLGRYSQVR